MKKKINIHKPETVLTHSYYLLLLIYAAHGTFLLAIINKTQGDFSKAKYMRGWYDELQENFSTYLQYKTSNTFYYNKHSYHPYLLMKR